jgi:hypothetical protein
MFLFFKESKKVEKYNDVDTIRSLFVQIDSSIKSTFSVNFIFSF